VYRSFLSWRYLVSRPTNLIGIVGILVGVGALILILSIMTGFLQETRDTMRGSLADMILSVPHADDGAPAEEPDALLAALREDPRIEAAAAQLVWFGLLAREDGATEALFSDTMFAQRAGVKLIGIDVADEFAATDLRAALDREPRFGSKVFDSERPFELPPSEQRRGRPRPAGSAATGTWCHGEAGIAVTRMRAAALLGSEPERREAELALETTRRHVAGLPAHDLEDLSLCHGASGSADVLLRAGGRSPEALGLGAAALERGDADRLPGGVPGGKTPGLFLGLGGIGWWFLRLHDARIPSPLGTWG
jgi:hypothetical protein